VAATGYPIPAAPHRTELVNERSRFIATIGHAASPEEARSFIDAVRAELADATHHCWAFVAGPPGSTTHIGLSDAGEPHGTAGRPMLDVLLHSGVGEVVAVVTRYYGGVKLGKGGLVRAYGGTVQHALATLPTVERLERVELTIDIAYAGLEAVRRLLQELRAETLAELFAGQVRIVAAVPVAAEERLRHAIADLTAGRGRITHAEPRDSGTHT
jgi:uncharacterized YigZ family protein